MRALSIGAVLLGALVGCGGRIDPETEGAGTDASTTADGSTIDATVDTHLPDPATDTSATPDTGTTSSDAGPPIDTHVPDPPSDGGATCPECVTNFCRPEVEVCAAVPKCKAGVDCINACPGPGSGRTECINTCISTAADPKLDDVVTCVLDHCKDPCDFR